MAKSKDNNLTIKQICEMIVEEIGPILGLGELKRLGCGTYGCAYKIKDEDKVVKIGLYSDTEFQNANWILQTQPKEGFWPKIYKTLKVDLPEKYKDLRSVRKLPLTACYLIWREPLNNVPYSNLDWIEENNTALEEELHVSLLKHPMSLIVKDNVSTETAVALIESNPGNAKDEMYLTQMAEIYHICMRQYGILFPDTKADAWGVRAKARERLVLRDLGAIKKS